MQSDTNKCHLASTFVPISRPVWDSGAFSRINLILPREANQGYHKMDDTFICQHRITVVTQAKVASLIWQCIRSSYAKHDTYVYVNNG
jgi:hypothetical protein